MWRCRFVVETALTQNARRKNKVQTVIFRHVKAGALSPPKSETEYFDESIKWLLFSVPVVTFALGCWQVKRKQWKTDLMKSLFDRTSSEPIDLPYDLSELKDLEYRPVKVVGHFLHDREILITPRSLVENDKVDRPALMSSPKSNQGSFVVTPFQLHDRDNIILVNRGWVPKDLKSSSARLAGQLEGEVELTGIVRLTERREPFIMKNDPPRGFWYYRDLDTMAEFARTSPVWIDVMGNPNPPPGYPVPNQTRIRLRDEHVSYIITWFGLSIITAVMWHRLFILKKPLL